MQITPATYQKITLIALVALIVIIITGGAVRLTGSGLGCSDWPTCEENQLIADFEYHAMVEFINRVITGITAIAVILAVLGAIFLKPRHKNLIWWASGLATGVLAQVILGGLVVLYHLTPPLVIAHFLLSMYLVYNAVVLNHKTRIAFEPEAEPHIKLGTKSHLYIFSLTRLATLLAAAAIFTGTILTGAGPHGGGEDVRRFNLDIPNLARIHASIVIAFTVIVALGWVALYYFRAPKKIWQKGKFLLLVTLFQVPIGYIQYFSDVPELLVGIHIAGATLLWTTMIYFYLEVRVGIDSVKRVDAPIV